MFFTAKLTLHHTSSKATTVMQALHTARRLALQASRASQITSRDLIRFNDQCGLSGLARSSCSNQDGKVYFQMLLRGFSAESADSAPPTSPTPSDQAKAFSASPAAASASPPSDKDSQYYYGQLIPNKRPKGAGQKYLINLKAKIRQQVKASLPSRKLKEAGAPETAAAAPEGELPQNSKAAEHQKEYLKRLQRVQALDAAAEARREKARSNPASRIRQKRQKQQQQDPKAKAAKSPSDASKAKASSGKRPVKASSGSSAAKVLPGSSAAVSASATVPSSDATAAQRSSDASRTEALSDSAKSVLDPVQASPDAQATSAPASAPATPEEAADSSAPSNSDWRLQQRQWQASQTPRAMPASAGIDLLQSPASPPPPPQQKRKPGFQGRGLGRPHTPYAPFAPTPQPQEELEPELSPEEQLQQEEAMESVVRQTMYTDKPAKDLGAEDGGLYYPLNAALLPEAFQDFYTGTLIEKGGCKGLQDETAYSHSNQILYRQCIHGLHQKAARQGQKKKRVYLTGPRGCGKTIALTSLVDWARSQGWLVLYVPSAQRLIEGGTFQKGEDGLWDTPEVAKDLLRSMVTNHKDQLADIATTSGQTLLQLVEEGLNGSKPGDISSAAANLITEMASTGQTPVLIAVDDYNVLYSHTNYHEWMNEVYRRQLQPHELRLASAFKLLERQEPKNGMFVCASTLGGPVSPQLRVPGAELSHKIPKFSIDEAALQLCHYAAQGVSPHSLEWNAIQMAYFQTDGIPRELRLSRGRLETLPSAAMLAMQAAESGFDFEPDNASLKEQSHGQAALA